MEASKPVYMRIAREKKSPGYAQWLAAIGIVIKDYATLRREICALAQCPQDRHGVSIHHQCQSMQRFEKVPDNLNEVEQYSIIYEE